jgi:hypothetical protein
VIAASSQSAGSLTIEVDRRATVAGRPRATRNHYSLTPEWEPSGSAHAYNLSEPRCLPGSLPPESAGHKLQLISQSHGAYQTPLGHSQNILLVSLCRQRQHDDEQRLDSTSIGVTLQLFRDKCNLNRGVLAGRGEQDALGNIYANIARWLYQLGRSIS